MVYISLEERPPGIVNMEEIVFVVEDGEKGRK